MQVNNYLPNIVQLGARKATKYVCSGAWYMRNAKIEAHRSYRRKSKEQMAQITKGDIDMEEFDNYPDRTSMCTAWDVW